MAEDVKNLVGRGLISRDAYASFIKKFNPQFGAAPAQAAPAESKAGKKVSAPLDVRPPAARNKPKPYHAKAKKKHSAFAKRAGHNPPKPEFAENAEDGSVVETVARPVATAARRFGKALGQSDKPKAATSATLGIRG